MVKAYPRVQYYLAGDIPFTISLECVMINKKDGSELQEKFLLALGFSAPPVLFYTGA